jgi:hypothetical protein
MQGWLEHGVDAARAAMEAALDAWGGAAAVIDAYEAVVGSAVTAQEEVARSVGVAPVRSLVALCADLTRDIGAVQASAARWVLDA